MKQIDKLLTAVKQAIKRILTCPKIVDSDAEADRLRVEGFEGVIIVDDLGDEDAD